MSEIWNCERTAKELRVDLNINDQIAIDLDFILLELNIVLKYIELKDGVLGACKSKGLNKLIVINPNIRNFSRERFTIAHELGHLRLHHGPLYCKSSDLNILSERHSKEKEANAFAIELLLPRNVLLEVLKIQDISLKLVKNISDQYKTSLTATAIRLVKLEEEPAAVVYHENNKIKWIATSEGCRYEIYDDVIGDLSLAHQTNASNPVLSGEVPIKAWCNVDDNISCYEETMFFSKLNQYISIIKFENEDYM